MRAELRDSLEFLYPDSLVNKRPCRSMRLDVARGGTISLHVLLNDLKENRSVRAMLRRNGREVRTAQWFRLLDVPVEANTGPVGSTEKKGERNRFVTRRAPFRVYDAMEPVKSPIKVSSPTTALRLQLPVPVNAGTGQRQYTLQVRSGKELHEFSLTANVCKPVIPPAGRDSFPYTNWFHLEQMAWRHGLKEWSEAHWRMVRRYADLMYHARQNTFLIPLNYIFRTGSGEPVLDRERLRRIVRIFSNAGLHYIEGGHIATRPNGDWSSTFLEIWLTGTPATSPKGNGELAHMTHQLMEEIERNGWRERWIQHVSDEPWHPNALDYRILTGMVHKYMPGIPILDATMSPELTGSVDIWCPQAQKYQKHRKRFEAQRALGDRVCFYTCCFPGGPWLNRLLDMELLRPALLGWGAALYDLDGFLHWGFNQCQPDQDPFNKSVVNLSGSFFLPPGDTHIAYPGKSGPWSSVRLEAQREGFEDLELLRKLRSRKNRKADAIVRKCISGFNKYTKDVRTFRAARKALLRALSA